MRRALSLVFALVLAVPSSGCIWFHQRDLTLHVENEMPRLVRFQVSLDKLAVFGSSVDQLYNATHAVPASSDSDVVIPKVGNGVHELRFWFHDSAGAVRKRSIQLSYGETTEDDATRIDIRISESALDLKPVK